MMNDILKISPQEKVKLRKHRIKVRELHKWSVGEIQTVLGTSKIRAMELYALSEFQSLPSIGVRFAHDLISLGYCSLNDLKRRKGAALLDAYEKKMGVWTDPCVEDQFRLVVYLANHPGEVKNWWDFTEERKAFRKKNGYPASRPTTAWHQVKRYQTSQRIPAKKDETKTDLAVRLKRSLVFMKQHCGEKISLAQIADASALSEYHFLRQFKEIYEVTPFQYLSELRLKKASRLLKTTTSSIVQVASFCGFENPSSFIRLFKKKYSMTPLSFRQMNSGDRKGR